MDETIPADPVPSPGSVSQLRGRVAEGCPEDDDADAELTPDEA